MCGSGGVGKTTIAAALGLAAAVDQGGQVLVLTVDPARRLADALGVGALGNTRDAGAGGGVRRGRGRAARRAVGGDARHQGRLGRADPPPRARRRGPRRGARQPAVPEHHQPLRAQPRLPRDGAAARPARVGRVRPRHRRHAAVAQRPRRARRAGADGRVLRQPAAALAHRAVPVAPVHRGVEAVLPSRRPGARLAASCRTSPSSSSSSRRWRRASSPGPGRSRRCSATRARRSSSCRRWRRRRRTRPRTSPASCVGRDYDLGAIIANRVLPARADVARRRPRAPSRLGEARRARSLVADGEPSSIGAVGAVERRVVRDVLAEVGGRFHDVALVATREAERRAELAALAPHVLDVEALPIDVHDLGGLLDTRRASCAPERRRRACRPWTDRIGQTRRRWHRSPISSASTRPSTASRSVAPATA